MSTEPVDCLGEPGARLQLGLDQNPRPPPRILRLVCRLKLVAFHLCGQHGGSIRRLARRAAEDTHACQRIVHTSAQYGGVIWAGRMWNDPLLDCGEVLVVQLENALDSGRKRLCLLRLVGGRRQLGRQV